VLARTHRAIGVSAGTSAGAVGAVLARAKLAGLTAWSEVEALGDDDLDRLLCGASSIENARPELP
jgi:hypothetical protein